MSLYQTLYFMSLAGGFAGLLSWALTALLSATILSNRPALADLTAAALLGLIIGLLTVAFSDRWSGNRVVGRYVLAGGAIGLVAGLLGGLAMIPITEKLGPQMPFLARLLSWMLVGSLIGLGLGLRWVMANKMRVVHACLGGLVGGAVGGSLFHILGSRIPDLTQALGFVLVGVGICFGVTLAPILLRDGLLKFVSSGDARAQAKFGRSGKEWEIRQGDTLLIGSQPLDLNKTAFAVGVQVFIPDAAIAPRHAILFGKEGRFYIARHPDINNPQGLARYVLRVRGRTVTTSQELRAGDDILVGRTAIKFMTRKEG
ncbi:MAG: FHA domain-containing protein [Bryobacteraceae bacterium]